MDKCYKCGSTDLEPRKSKNHQYRLYCNACDAFQKVLSKEEANAMLIAKEERGEPDQKCPYCDREYVIPIAYDGGITIWENIEHNYCPKCGRKR